MKKFIGDLGRSEWELLNICWKLGSKTSVREIHEESLKKRMRSYATVKTMLDRLVQKGHIERVKFGPLWLYSPKKSQKSTISHAIEDFIKTVLNNETVPIYQYIIESKKYEKDYVELKELLDNVDEEDNS